MESSTLLLQILIVALVVFLLIGFFALFSSDKSSKKEIRNYFLASASLILTLTGILLAISDDYLSQFGYDTNNIEKFVKQKKEGVNLANLTTKKKSPTTEYILVLDVSSSTINEPKHEVNKDIDSMITVINDSGKIGSIRNDFKCIINDGKKFIPFQELLRVRLLYTLIRLGEIPDSVNFSVILFADQASHLDLNENSLDKRIKEAINSVKSLSFNGNNTDFVKLFTKINAICYSEGSDYTNTENIQYGTKDYVVLFFSDYKHDAKDIKGGDLYKGTAEGLIEDELIKMTKSSACFKFYTVIEDGKEKKSNITVNQMIGKINTRSISPNNSEYNLKLRNCDLLDLSDVIDYEITTDPVPFFYFNGVYEDSISTKLIFKGISDLKKMGKGKSATKSDNDEFNYSFCLGNYSLANRQNFTLIHEKKYYRLSNTSSCNLNIRNTDICTVIMSGYIPSPDQTPNLIITDKATGIHFIIPIVFFKEYPTSGCYIIAIILILIIISIFHFLILKHSGTSLRVTWRLRVTQLLLKILR